ncbi:unnamed protein product [Arctia plantaginis]|uniref:Uncharacterized protein n=1 Tax=Arctia plantaginis TaxID=874455 RepID=A0A8S0ZZQ4_ARCPL|nr:unnamed protein product [Arctia plantaginis]
MGSCNSTGLLRPQPEELSLRLGRRVWNALRHRLGFASAGATASLTVDPRPALMDAGDRYDLSGASCHSIGTSSSTTSFPPPRE